MPNGRGARLPSLVAGRRLVAANSRLEAVEYGAFTSGPAIGGLLVQVLTVPFAIVTDAVSYLASGLLISAIRVRESPPSPAGRRGLWPEIWAGVAFVIRQPLLRPVMIAGSMLMLFDDGVDLDPGGIPRPGPPPSRGHVRAAPRGGWLPADWRGPCAHPG